MKHLFHLLTIIISVGLSYALIKPQAEYKAVQAMEYAIGCEQRLITGNLEPMCAGYLEYIGYDVETQAIIYSKSPYNLSMAKEKTLAQTREIGVKP